MKKLIYGTLFLTLVGIGFVGCKKKENTKAAIESRELNFDNEFHVASDGKLLIFQSSKEYEKVTSVISNVSRKSKFVELVKSLNYLSYAEKQELSKSSNSYDDPFLNAILNEDGVVQIGDFFTK